MGMFSIVVVFAVIATGVVIRFLITDTVDKSIMKELSSSTTAIRTMVASALDISVRNHLKGIAQKNVMILEQFHKDIVSGKMEPSQAKQLAEQILLSQTIGKTGYIYTITSSSILSVHPNASMKNRDMSNHWLARAQVAQKNGYIEYDWKNPDEQKERPKALYMAYFEPWDWIVSVSSYREEFVSLLNIDDIRSVIESFRFGETGYAFILDGDCNVILQPKTSNTIKIDTDSDHWKQMHKIMLTQKSGQLKWKWLDGPDNKKSEKLVFFHYIPEVDWFVVSLAYNDEIREPLYILRNIILISAVCILLIVLPIVFYLGVVITQPLRALSQKMGKASSGDFGIHADETAFGEIGHMAGHFNSYIKRLKTAQVELRDEIEERIQAEAQLKVFAKVFDNALEGISVTDAEGNILSINKAFSDITGYAEKEVIGQNPRVLKSDRHDTEFYQKMWKSIIHKGHWVGEIWNRRKSGEAYPEILSISTIKNQKKETTNFVAVFHDISEMKSKEDKIKYQAYHDALTGLPNRLLALDRLGMAIAHAKRQTFRVALFFMDIDNFKNINDTFGHTTGDTLLQNVGSRLKDLLRNQDTVARIGGDEFLIIIDAIESEQGVIELAKRVLKAFHKPILVDEHELSITLSIGISFYPKNGTDIETLIKNADVAMYQSKSLGKNQYHVFTS